MRFLILLRDFWNEVGWAMAFIFGLFLAVFLGLILTMPVLEYYFSFWEAYWEVK